MTYEFVHNCQFRVEDLDRIYTDIFGADNKNGFFVEVGASDGDSFSNTAKLADIGWSGVYIEPVASLADACRTRHAKNNGIKVLTCASGRMDGLDTLCVIPEWGTATSNIAAAEKISSIGPKLFLSRVLKLDTILDITGIRPLFDLLVIDVDFGEIEVLSGFYIDYWKPKLVIIELHEESQHPLSEDVRQFAMPYFAAAGYEKIYKDGINTIFNRRAS